MSELFNGHGWKVILEPATLPNGKVKAVARVARADSAHIIAFIKPDKILMLREYRPYYGDYIWMLPSGRIDKEKDVATGAQRELREETGYRAEKLELLFVGNHSESIIQTNHFFVAHALVKDPLPADADELFEVHVLTLAEALDHVLHSKIVHMPSAYGLMRYMRESETQPLS